MARAIGCSDASSSEPAIRSSVVAVDAVGGHDVDEAHHAGGDGAGLVEHDRVDPPGGLEDLRPLDDHAELRAPAGADHDRRRRGQAEGARAGDDQHGDGGGERDGRVLADPEPEPEGGDGQGDDDRHEHRRDAVGQSLHRRLAALGVLHETGDLGELGVGTDPGRPHDQSTTGVDGGTGHGVAGADVDRDRFAGEQRGVDRRRAVFDDAVGGHLLTRADDEAVADGELGDRDALLDAVAQHGDVLGAQLQQRPESGAGASLGAGLEVAAGEDERRHPGGDLEVDEAGTHVPIGGPREPVGHPRDTGVTEEQRVQRPSERRQHPDRDQRVHRGGGVTQVEPGRPVEWPRPPGDDGRGQRQRQPLPVVELPGLHHRQHDHRHRQHDRGDQPGPQGAGLVDFGFHRARRVVGVGGDDGTGGPGRVAGRFDLGDQLVRRATASGACTLARSVA